MISVCFNPRPPRGGRRVPGYKVISTEAVSIHAPRVGGDQDAICAAIANKSFNPRPPRGGRLCAIALRPREIAVSIHAPRVGGDTAVDISIVCDRVSIHAPRVGGDAVEISGHL